MTPLETIAKCCAFNWAMRQTKSVAKSVNYAEENARDPSFLSDARGIIADLGIEGFVITGET